MKERSRWWIWLILYDTCIYISYLYTVYQIGMHYTIYIYMWVRNHKPCAWGLYSNSVNNFRELKQTTIHNWFINLLDQYLFKCNIYSGHVPHVKIVSVLSFFPVYLWAYLNFHGSKMERCDSVKKKMQNVPC